MTDLEEICALIKTVIRWGFKVLGRAQQSKRFAGKSQEVKWSDC